LSKEFSRARRIGEQIQRELAQLIQHEINDPRLGKMVSVSGVEVSRDLAHAKVYITQMIGDDSREDTLVALNSAAGFLRSEVGRRLSVRTVPQMKFFYDNSIERGGELSALIDKAIASDSVDE
jgi:ribosome-binding factor A